MGRLVTDCVVEFSFIVLLRTYSQVAGATSWQFMEILIPIPYESRNQTERRSGACGCEFIIVIIINSMFDLSVDFTVHRYRVHVPGLETKTMRPERSEKQRPRLTDASDWGARAIKSGGTSRVWSARSRHVPSHSHLAQRTCARKPSAGHVGWLGPLTCSPRRAPCRCRAAPAASSG